MYRIRLIAIAALLASTACSPPTETTDPAASPSGAAEPSAVAAEIDGMAITTNELDAWIKEDMFREQASNPTELYALRDAALPRLVAERRVSALAADAGVSVEQLLADKIAALGDVTDAETLEFYEENKERLGTAEYDTLQKQIRDFLGSQREATARSDLETGGNLVVFLEPPRIDVAPIGPSKGPADAPITIVEFSDFQCPYCRRVIPTLQEIVDKYQEQVRIVFRNFPLGNHSRAKPAAVAALCADRQDQFWAYHDRLFENSRALSDEDLTRYATELELDVPAFESCLADEAITTQVDTDFSDGRSAGVTGTPAFFVNGILLSGAKPTADFIRTIDAELARLKEGA